jgi:hypothetical protein
MLKLVRGAASIDLPNPALGDGLAEPLALKVLHLANGLLRTNRIQKDLASKLVCSFTAITQPKRTELEAFLSAGLTGITLYSYDGTVWVGSVTSTPIEYVNVGKNNCYDLYSFQFDFQGRSVGSFGELTTEDDILLTDEAGSIYVTESTPEFL